MFKTFATRVALSAVVATALVGCSSDDDDDDMAANVVESDDMIESIDNDNELDDGLMENVVDSVVIGGAGTLAIARPVDEAIGALRTALMGNEAILVLDVIDHQANATAAGLELRPTQLQLFGNPALGTPLMQLNQMAGLDLPQKMLFWQKADGSTILAYNSADYLRQRHSLEGSDAADTALGTIATVLNAQALNASGNTDDSAGPVVTESTVSAEEGVMTVTSTTDMDTTYNTLIAAIEGNENLGIAAQIDHQANAANIDEDLDPTRLVIFGNPNAGTPLMQVEQSVGMDLPQKMLVFANAQGEVTIAYNDPAYLAQRHGITGQDDRLTAISTLLASLANTAAGVITP